jgi:hypothetical protein
MSSVFLTAPSSFIDPAILNLCPAVEPITYEAAKALVRDGEVAAMLRWKDRW